MQYHALNGKDKSITLDDIIRNPFDLIRDKVMVLFCVQMVEAILYLHKMFPYFTMIRSVATFLCVIILCLLVMVMHFRLLS